MAKLIFNGKNIGEIYLDSYITHRNKKIHYCYKAQGYPISKSVLKILIARKIKKVIIIEDAYEIRKYVTQLENYIHAPIFQLGGFEKQRCYPLEKMIRIQ